MNLRVFNKDDYKFIIENLEQNSFLGSDISLSNLFYLQKKYNILLDIKNGILFRYYQGNENRLGYGFPISLKKNNENYLEEALSLILEDANIFKRKVKFCLCSLEQKNMLEETIRKCFNKYSIYWNSFLGDSDYIYETKNLAELPGKKFHKKKNHISKFMRLYENDFNFKTFEDEDISKDVLYVAKKWMEENPQIENNDLEMEGIKLALENKNLFFLKGAVLYVKGEACAMTLASEISSQCLDIHYEKALSEFSKDGAYAVINNLFAKKYIDYLYFNREEDMEIEGLRKAKLSYRPDMILDKYFGELVKC